MTRPKRQSRSTGKPHRLAISPSQGNCGFSSAFARSGATSAVFHTTVLLILAFLYAAESVVPMKPIALSFEKAEEGTEDECPSIDIALEVPKADWNKDEEKEELLQALSDLQSTTQNVAPATIEMLSEPPLQIAAVSQARPQDLNAVLDVSTNTVQSSFEDGDEQTIGTQVQVVRFPVTTTGHGAMPQGTSPGLVSAAEFGNRLQAAGAKTGDVQISLAWNTIDDIDLHVKYTPGNGLVDNINWVNRMGRLSNGMLDVDMNAHSGMVSPAAVENVFWPTGSSPNGRFTVYVHFFRSWSGQTQVPVLVRIKRGNQITQHSVKAILYANPQPVQYFDFPNRDSERKF